MVSFYGYQNSMSWYLQLGKITDRFKNHAKLSQLIRILVRVTLMPVPLLTKLPATLIQFDYFMAFIMDPRSKTSPWLSGRC